MVLVAAADTAGKAVAEARGRRARRVTFSMLGAGAHEVPTGGRAEAHAGAERWKQKHTRVLNRKIGCQAREEQKHRRVPNRFVAAEQATGGAPTIYMVSVRAKIHRHTHTTATQG